jgi:hypothetical protein
MQRCIPAQEDKVKARALPVRPSPEDEQQSPVPGDQVQDRSKFMLDPRRRPNIQMLVDLDAMLHVG